MSKLMQKVVFFIEPTDKDGLASTIGNFYMNRFAIDEDASHEIVNIYAPKKCNKYLYSIYRAAENKEQIGMDQIFSSKFVIKWGVSSRVSSSLYCPMRNSDQMTIAKMHSTLCCAISTVYDSL